MCEQIPLVISFSGGKSSGLMTHLLLEHFPERIKVIVFANTGKEREETLEFVQNCQNVFGWKVIWVEAVINPEYRKGTRHRVVDFNSASRNGEPYHEMIRKYGIPNKAFPHCTRELKRHAIASFAKNELGWKPYETAVGIRADEHRRINWKEAEKSKYIYPLTTFFPSSKRDVNEWWQKQSFSLNLEEHEGNCDLCWKKSDKKLIRHISEKPELLDWWNEMEKEYADRQGEHRQIKTAPSFFFRHNRSAKQIKELAELENLQNKLF